MLFCGIETITMLPNDVWMEETLFLGIQYKHWTPIMLLCLLIAIAGATARGRQQ
jgi:hypothetical protein